MNKIKNFLSFDLEFWYDSEFIKDKKVLRGKDFIQESVERVKNILDAHNIKATFFVTGEVVEKYPHIIKKLDKSGHEIASHSYTHRMIGRLGKKRFEEGIKLSKQIIKKTIGKNPVGFRAPSWSISAKEFWVYRILDKLGFRYSSSLFPVNMGLYGSSKFPVTSFKPIKKLELTEIPVHPFEIFGIRIPFSGGIYFRIFPKKLISFFIKKINERGHHVVLYLHPWEFCPEIPRVKTSLIGKIITYWGLKKNKDKLDDILSKFDFCPFKNNLSTE